MITIWDNFVILIGVVGSIASLFSLWLTWRVYRQVEEIRSYYQFTTRIPDLVKELDQRASTLSDYLNEFDRFSEAIEVELAQCGEVLEVINKQLDNKRDAQEKFRVERLLGSIRTYSRKNADRNAAWDIYVETIRVTRRISELYKDRILER
jgi:hypothetical protein